MSARKLGLTAVLVVFALAALSSLALAAEFSADVVMTAGQTSMTSAIFVKGRNVRQEMSMGKDKTIVIISAEKKMVWMIDPARKTYMAEPIPADKLSEMLDEMRGKIPAAAAAAQGAKTTRLGTEKVNGYPCDKTVTEGKGGKVTVWYSKKLDLALRTEITAEGGGKKMITRQEVKNIKERKLPDSLFQVPKDYKQTTPPKRPAPSASGRGRAPAPRGGTK